MSRVSESVAFETVANPIVVPTPAASQNLSAAVHANRIIVINSELTDAAQKFVLPKATGSGDKYTIFNNIVSTQDIVVAVRASTGDVMAGVAVAFSQTVAESGDVFLTTATDDTYTFNNTTSGGLRGDKFEAIDWKQDSAGTGTWLVEVRASGGGTLATGFSAAVA